jgi:carbon storage regulator
LLILTRKEGQSILINNNIEILISSIDGEQVKIGIKAPKDIPILRKEVYDAIQSSNRAAVSTQLDPISLRNLPNPKK